MHGRSGAVNEGQEQLGCHEQKPRHVAEMGCGIPELSCD